MNIQNFFTSLSANQNLRQTADLTAKDSIQAQKVSESSGREQALENGTKLLKEMLAGDIFDAKLLSMKDGTALLELSDGSMVNAKMQARDGLMAGQTLTYMLESNSDNNISIKVMNPDLQQNVLLDKALSSAGFANNEANRAIVNSLLEQNMPIDAKTIGDMVKNSLRFPETKLGTLANLQKLNLPINENNIASFEAYQSYEHTISGELDNFSQALNSLSDSILTGTQEGNSENGVDIGKFSSLIEDLYEGLDGQSIESSGLEDYLDQAEIKDLSDLLREVGGNDTAPAKNEWANQLADKLDNKDLSLKDLLSQLAEHFDNEDLKAKLGSSLGQVKEKLLKSMVDETMKLKPQDVAEDDGIKNYYKRVRSSLEHITKDLADEAKNLNLSKNLDNIKSNIDFMNDLNKNNMAYVQIPIHYKENNANGELYVYTNKRKTAGQDSDTVSALLHLDMDNLGPVDVYVKLAGKNLSTNFCLETEELLDFINDNIDKLTARLEAKGYQTKFEMHLSNDENKFDVAKEVLDVNESKVAAGQFMLDVKV